MARKPGTAVYKDRIQLNIKPQTHEQIKEIAKLRGENISMVVRTAIQAEIEYAPELENEHK